MGVFLTRGQPSALAAVERIVEREDPPHALILAGPPHVGKTTLALDLAAGLLCLAADSHERPCRRCSACRKVQHGNHVDVHRLAPEGAGEQIRLGQVQALVVALALLPMEGRFRIAIVEDAHRLNQDAQNALLKTLEEPTGAVCLVLTVADEAVILPTVKSRCARSRLGPVSPEAIAAVLAERGLADAVGAASLARLSAGRPGLALALALEPGSSLAHGRLVRSLLDLLAADRRSRLDAAPQLMVDGGELSDAAERGRAAAALLVPGGTERDRPHDHAADDGDGAAAQGSKRRERTRRADAAAPRRASASVSPAERRVAVLKVVEAWRELARDLALVGRGGRREVRHAELLDELADAGDSVDALELAAFLEQLDRLEGAIEAYANPELSLDALLLAWPRRARAT